MFIRSKDSTHPVLIYIHGGMPFYFPTEKYPAGLEDYFTVVRWEQRGSGISYSADIPPETLNSKQMINDVLEVTNYLRHRFGKEKIYLMGHSGGTFIGIQAVAQTQNYTMPIWVLPKCLTNSNRKDWLTNLCFSIT